MKCRNLRFRITAAIAVICCVVVATLGVGLYTASERMELALVEQLVSEELDFLVQRHGTDPDYQPTHSSSIEYYIIQPGKEDEVPVYLHELPQGHHEIQFDGGASERNVMVREVGGLGYAVVYDIGPYEASEQRFKRVVLLSLAAIVGLAPLVGYGTATFLTRELSLLTAQVAARVPDSKHEPFQRPGQEQEVALLAQAFDQYHALLLAMIRREQEFTANVSHELRTPLTSLRSTCELLAQDPGLSDRSKARVRSLLKIIDDMSGQVEALLFLARGDAFREQESLSLYECINDALLHYRDELAAKNLSCTVDVAPTVTLVANRQALGLVLNNLVRNAVAYTETGGICFSHADGLLELTDSGVGIAPERLPHIFERDYRAQKRHGGLGLGLHIVQRVCERCGWDVSVHSRLGQGTTFALRFASIPNA